MPNLQKMKIFVLLLPILFLNSFSGTDREKVTVKAGELIQVGETFICLNKTSVSEILEVFELKDIFDVSFLHWDGVDAETGESTYGNEFIKIIPYKGIDFEFKGKTQDNLTLKWIRLKNIDYLDVKVNDHISLGDTNPSIDKYFVRQNKFDYISDDSLTYNLYSQGISFKFSKEDGNRVLIEVSIHYKVEEEN